MSTQVPEEALGTAVGVLVYSLVCTTCSCLLIWLVWIHRERTSYVAFLSYFTLLSTVASVIQQCHLIARWRDNKTLEYYMTIGDASDPELGLVNLPTDVDRVLFYIQYYSYNVESLLTLFWAGALTRSVYGYTELKIYKRIRRWTLGVTKSTAVLLPALLIGLLHADVVRQSPTAFIVLADICMMASLAIGAILLLAILGKYIHIRRNVLSWHVGYGNSAGGAEETGRRRWPRNRVSVRKKSTSIYDRWMLTRFAIAFVVFSCFQISLIFFQGRQLRINSTDKTHGPDLSAERARGDFLTFTPGVTPGLLTFVVFGTSRPFRETMCTTFIPKRFRKGGTIPETPADLSGRAGSSRDAAAAAGYEGAWRLQDIVAERDPSVRSEDEWPLHSGLGTARVGEQGI
ncbi:hypothetical protein F5X99DRAFT_26135 [Biscogniauxia marginata]|nr:hypothetical protein F5X99DRAFT_26135 [Biscogniauxia marginata]